MSFHLDLHRACATSRPDQKRHNRSLERLVREADLHGTALLAACVIPTGVAEAAVWNLHPAVSSVSRHRFPGPSIPEVFDQAAEPLWRRSRRSASALRNRRQLTPALAGDRVQADRWAWVGLQPLARWSPVLRLPRGEWASQGQGPAGAGGCMQGGTWQCSCRNSTVWRPTPAGAPPIVFWNRARLFQPPLFVAP